MALDAKELQKLASLLGEALAPRIREAVAENVAVRMEVLAQTLRSEQKEALDAVQDFASKAIADTATSIRKDVSELALASEHAASAAAIAYDAKLLSTVGALQESLKEQFTSLNTKLEASTATQRESLAVVERHVESVERAIPTVPEVPEPLRLVDGGDLSEEMRSAMDLVVRQVFNPMLETALAPVREAVEASSGVVRTALDGVESVRSSIDETNKIFGEERGRLNTRLVDLATAADNAAKSTATELRAEIDSVAAQTSTALESAKVALDGVHAELDARDKTIADNIRTVESKIVAASSDIARAVAAQADAMQSAVEEVRVQTATALLASEKATAESILSVESGFVTTQTRSNAEVSSSVVELDKKLASSLTELRAHFDTIKSATEATAQHLDALNTTTTDSIAAVQASITQVDVRAVGIEATVAKSVEEVEKKFSAGLAALSEDIKAFDAIAREYTDEKLGALRLDLEETRSAAVVQHGATTASVKESIDGLSGMLKQLQTDADHKAEALGGNVSALSKGLDELATTVSEQLTEHRSAINDQVVDTVKELTASAAVLADRVSALSVELREETKTACMKLMHDLDIEVRLNALGAGIETQLQAVKASIAETNSELIKHKEATTQNINNTAASLRDELQTGISPLAEAGAKLAEETTTRIAEVTKAINGEMLDAVAALHSETTSLRSESLALVNALREENKQAFATVNTLAITRTEQAAESVIATMEEKVAAVVVRIEAAVESFTSGFNTLAECDKSLDSRVDAVAAAAHAELVEFDKSLAPRLDSAAQAVTRLEERDDSLDVYAVGLSSQIEAIERKFNVSEADRTTFNALVDETIGQVRAAVVTTKDASDEALFAMRAELLTKQVAVVEDLVAGIEAVSKARQQDAETAVELFAQMRVEAEAKHAADTAHLQEVTSAATAGLAELRSMVQSSFEEHETRVGAAIKAVENEHGGFKSEVQTRIEELTKQTANRLDQAAALAAAEIERAVVAAEASFTAKHIADMQVLRDADSQLREALEDASASSVVNLQALAQVTRELEASIPKAINEGVAAFEAPMLDAAANAAEGLVMRMFEANTESVEAVARIAAVGAVPAVVADLTTGIPEALRALLVPEAVAAATRVATEANKAAGEAIRAASEAAIATARAEAGEVAAVRAAAAAEGLRESLLAALDPTDRIARSIEAALPLSVREAVSDATGTAEQKLYLQLADKIQKEIDRIPRPRDGKDGTDGEDARVLAPVPHELNKRYDAGAWVVADNGVWVSARSTNATPAADSPDWDCVTPGVKALEAVLAEDGRTIELHFELSNGSFHKSQVRLPIPIVQGVYVAERTYSRDDICTFDGSWWEAQKDGKLPRPGSDPAWKLSVKHGKDGKDLKQPAPPIIRYAPGITWQPDVEYPTNSVVEHAGVHWLAMRSTRERPPFTTLVSNDTWLKLGA